MNETKHNIIVQALKFFSENDYDRASLNNIAEALNVTKGAIYHYFKSKDGLFEEVINFANEGINSFFIEMVPESPCVKDVIDTCLHFTDLSNVVEKVWGIRIDFNYITFVNLMFSGIKKFPGMKDKFKESYTNLTTMLEGLIEKEKKEGIIKEEVDSRLIALEVVTLSEGIVLMLEFFTEEDRSKMKEIGNELWNRIKV